jgi:asparagine synthetase B (glutamine-hydrolysing)
MADLFAIASGGGGELSSSELACFSALEAELLAFHGGSVTHVDHSFCRVGVVSRHPSDQAFVRELHDPPLTVAWIGTPPERAGLELEDVARAVVSANGALLSRLEPGFTACLSDAAGRRSWLLSDRHGLAPLYVSRRNGGLACATKLLPLARSGVVERRLDPAAVVEFFTFEHVLGERTLLEGIEVFPPATLLEHGADRTRSTKYWIHPLLGEAERAARPSGVELFETLRSAVQKASRDGTSPGITLSGGLDSRVLLGAARSLSLEPKAYTFGTPGCRDIAYASELARRAKLSHVVVPIDETFLGRWLDYGVSVGGGMVAANHFHILSLADAVRAGSDVVLDGLAGDALSGAHLKWYTFASRNPDDVVTRLFSERATAWPTAEHRRSVLADDFARSTAHDPADGIRTHARGLHGKDAWRAAHRFDLFERQRRFIQYGPQLFRPFVRVETPFYDNATFDAFLRLGQKDLFEQRAYLSLIPKHLGDLAEVRDTLRNLPLTYPVALRHAKKLFDAAARRLPRSLRTSERPTTDYPRWFAEGLKTLVIERLKRGAAEGSGAVNFAKIVNDPSLLAGLSPTKLGCLLAFATFEVLLRAAPRERTHGDAPGAYSSAPTSGALPT